MAEKPIVVLWIRRNKNYYLFDKLEGMPVTHHAQNLKKVMLANIKRQKKIDYWDKLIDIKYIDFRKNIRLFFEVCYRKLDVDAIYFYETKNDFDNLPEGSWVFPVDEDDWIDPKIFNEAVKNIHIYNDKKIVYFDILHRKINGRYFNRNLSTEKGASFGFFFKKSNNYADRYKFSLDERPKDPDIYEYIDKIIGFKIDTPASFSVLDQYPLFKILSLFKKSIKNIDFFSDYFSDYLYHVDKFLEYK